MKRTINLFTDVSEIAIFDTVCLKHRLNEPSDWPTITAEVLAEINKGNLILIDVCQDGHYELEIYQNEIFDEENILEVFIRCPSGRLYFGPGEMVTGDGVEPGVDLKHNLRGEFIHLPPGNFLISILKIDSKKFRVGISNCIKQTENSFVEVPIFV